MLLESNNFIQMLLVHLNVFQQLVDLMSLTIAEMMMVRKISSSYLDLLSDVCAIKLASWGGRHWVGELKYSEKIKLHCLFLFFLMRTSVCLFFFFLEEATLFPLEILLIYK